MKCPSCKDAPPLKQDPIDPFTLFCRCGYVLEGRRCPHDQVKCSHECEGSECWREVEGS